MQHLSYVAIYCGCHGTAPQTIKIETRNDSGYRAGSATINKQDRQPGFKTKESRAMAE
jgi:hypothetical protein